MTVARDLMHSDPLTLPANASLLDVQHLLVHAAISGAPVVAPSGEVIGVLSATDVLRALGEALDEDRDEGEPDDVFERFEAITAADIATPEVVWVSPEASASHVAQVMRSEGIHRVLVGSDRRLEGILTAFDLLRIV